MSSYQTIIENLVKKGAKKLADNFVVKGVSVNEKDDYTQVVLTLDKPFEQYVRQEDGTYKKEMSNYLFTSTYSLTGVLKNCTSSFVASHCAKHVNAFEVVLADAKINLLLEEVKEGTDYVNPFASDQSKKKHFDHDTIITHIINVDGLDKEVINEIKRFKLFNA